MPERIQKTKQKSSETTAEVQEISSAEKADLEATDKLLGEIDELLDEMLTDQTAQEFVANFQQKGGE